LIAIKTLQIPSNDLLVKLQQEAKTISKLNHENIMKVLDFGVVRDLYPFMVVEYVHGETLSSLIKRAGRLSLYTALNIAVQIGDGLSHAHSRRVFHRDLTSNNVLLKDVESSTPAGTK
jgi:eukaryotic-like serine/threonine-protein kinase